MKLDDFRIVLGHVGIPRELLLSPKGKLYIRFYRPVDGDSVAVQYRNVYKDHSTGSVRPAHYRMFVGVYDDTVQQEIAVFEDMEGGFEETVEIDETSIPFRTKDEPVGGGQGRIRLEPIRINGRESLHPFVLRNTNPHTTIFTDGN